ncbi:MAG TPA: PPC domain-containing protein [Planctomycetaceae bacterium]|jgi:hypothetical protein|nr:PPC domain-containing protein [Planctomycetaceae bacterium]
MKTVGFVVCALVLLASAARGDATLPELSPIVIALSPLGARQGETLDVQFMGRNLDETRDITFARSDIKAQVLVADFFFVQARITVGPKVPVGLHDYRLRTDRGTHVGVFHVGSLPRVNEAEPNNDLKHAQRLTLPAMIDGVVDIDDYDVFRFHAAAGQTMIFDVLSTRAGTRFDSTLAILDERGAELDFIDDAYIQKDPYLAFTPKRTGDYFVRVAGSAEPIAGLFEGTPYSSYRLVAGAVPHMLHALPAGLRRGSTNELRITGHNLQQIDRVVLGDSLAQGKVIDARPDLLVVQMAVPASVAAGIHPLRAFAGSLEAMRQIDVVVSDLEERLVTPSSSRRNPQAIAVPVALSGVFDHKQAAHFFAFDVQAGERLVFDVDSMKLGFLDDPLVSLYTADGKLLASHDDRVQQNGDEPPNLDSYLVYTFEREGRYVAMIRDCANRGDPNYIYRLAVSRAKPDFDLRCLTPELTLFRGRTVPLPVRVRRFGGWSTPVEVWLEQLPAGITCEKVVAEPKDTIVKDNCALDRQLDGTNISLPIHVAPGTPAGQYPLRLRARGTLNGTVVEHTAEIVYWFERVGKVSGPVEDQKLVATVTDLPPIVLEVNHASRPGAYEPAEFISLAPGKAIPLPVLVRRYDDGKTPLTIEPVSPVEGLTFENNVLPPGKLICDLKLRAGQSFKPGRFKLRAGSAVSPPITLIPESPEEQP